MFTSVSSKMLVILVLAGTLLAGLNAQDDIPMQFYIGCGKERVVFKCGDKMAPEIFSATWGRGDAPQCPTAPEEGTPFSCSIDVTSILQEKCNFVKCVISPNKRLLPDLAGVSACDPFSSQNDIFTTEYKCRPLPGTETTPEPTTTTTTPKPTTPSEPVYEGILIQASGCQKVRNVYKCDNKMLPKILSAEWGVYNGNCSDQKIVERKILCSVDVTQTIQDERCNVEKGKCVIKPNKRSLGEVCVPEEVPRNAEPSNFFRATYLCEDVPAEEPEVDIEDEDPEVFTMEQNEIRLYKGLQPNEGIAQFKPVKEDDEFFGQWGTMCDQVVKPGGWPGVFCKQLGFNKVVEIAYAQEKYEEAFGVGSYNIDPEFPITYDSPLCSVDKKDYIRDCKTNKIKTGCGHDLDVYLVCGP